MHRQVVAACRWPVPTGQATKERKQKKRKKRKERIRALNLFGEHPKPRRTFPQTSTHKPGRSSKDHKRKNEQHFVLSATQKGASRMGRLGETRSSPLTCPSGTLSQEELFKRPQPRSPGETARTGTEKRTAFRAVCHTKQEHQKARFTENNLQHELVRAEP